MALKKIGVPRSCSCIRQHTAFGPAQPAREVSQREEVGDHYVRGTGRSLRGGCMKTLEDLRSRFPIESAFYRKDAGARRQKTKKQTAEPTDADRLTRIDQCVVCVLPVIRVCFSCCDSSAPSAPRRLKKPTLHREGRKYSRSHAAGTLSRGEYGPGS